MANIIIIIIITGQYIQYFPIYPGQVGSWVNLFDPVPSLVCVSPLQTVDAEFADNAYSQHQTAAVGPIARNDAGLCCCMSQSSMCTNCKDNYIPDAAAAITASHSCLPLCLFIM